MTIPLMCLNGKDIQEWWGLTPLEGTLNTLMKPAPMKALVTNENAALHGSHILSAPTSRRYQKQDFSLMFYMKAASMTDLHRQVETLVSNLKNGVNNTGVNELTIPELETTFRLIYSSVDKYTNFGLSGGATISIKFTEPNPNNRALNPNQIFNQIAL